MFRKGLKVIDRVCFGCECRSFVGEIPKLENKRPVLGITFPLPLSPWPALKIANRRIAIDTRNFIWIGYRPVVAVEPPRLNPTKAGFEPKSYFVVNSR